MTAASMLMAEQDPSSRRLTKSTPGGAVGKTSRQRERTCAGCREATSREDLVRLVLGPDGEVAPDLAHHAHGRGAWIHPRPACIERAVRQGLGRTFRRTVRCSTTELWTLIRMAADRRVEALTSAAWRAKQLELGSDAVRECLGRGRAELVLVATDARAAAETAGMAEAIAAGRVRVWGTKVILGRATGRAELGVAAVLDQGFAKALSSAVQLSQMPAPEAAGSRSTPEDRSTEDG